MARFPSTRYRFSPFEGPDVHRPNTSFGRQGLPGKPCVLSPSRTRRLGSARMAGNALVVEHLSVRFGTQVVLRDLSFAVPAGTMLAIIGPNGSGKTVLFRALIGALPHDGSVFWAPGTRLGYVPQKLDIERDVPL